jgi:integrase/recombinase XerD
MESQNATNTTLPSFAEYVEDRKYLKNVSPKTIQAYRHAWKAFGRYIEPVLASGGRIGDGIRSGVAHLMAKGLRPVSINSYLTALRAYLNWLHVEGHLKDKPRVQLLKCENPVIATLTPEQVQRIIRHAPKGLNDRRIHTFALMVLDTGLRMSEALSLTRDAVDFDNLVIKVRGKGGKHRLVAFSIECRRLLFRYLSRHDRTLVFSTRTGTALTKRNTGRDMKDLGRKLQITGVRFSPHTLRHTFAVTFLRNGGDIYMLSRILGHASITTTTVYLRSIGIDALSEAHQKFSPLLARAGR